jgi:hypothetical protein
MLQPWGRVEGVLRLNNRPAGNERMLLTEDCPNGGFKTTTKTDAQGRFRFAHAPASDCVLWRWLPCGLGWISGSHIYFTLHSGETANVAFGGKGRPVLGKCVVKNISDVTKISAFYLEGHTSDPTPPPETAGDMKRIEEWENSKAFKIALHNVRSFSAAVASNGLFQADDVTPGTYQLSFCIHVGGRVLHSKPKQIVVPPLPNPEKCEAFDLGTLEATFVERGNF